MRSLRSRLLSLQLKGLEGSSKHLQCHLRLSQTQVRISLTFRKGVNIFI